MKLKDWYVVTTHVAEDGDEILSRFTRENQMPWTDRGLLSLALENDRREWVEDDARGPDDTFT